jgi:hypothetical protein
MELAFLDRQTLLSAADLAFQVRAINLQLERDFIPAWSADRWAALGLDYRLPGGDLHYPAVGYARVDNLTPGAYWPMTWVDRTPAGLLGFHRDDAGAVTSDSRPNAADPLDATTPSHEAMETRGNPHCNVFVPGATSMIAAEAADPVEGDWYPIAVTLGWGEGAETRHIKLSNFLLPAWFVPGSDGPYDFLELCTRPLQIRPSGYFLELRDGAVVPNYGSELARAAVAAKAARAGSRLRRMGVVV